MSDLQLTLLGTWLVVCGTYLISFIIRGIIYPEIRLLNIEKVLLVLLFPTTIVIFVCSIIGITCSGMYNYCKSSGWFEEWK